MLLSIVNHHYNICVETLTPGTKDSLYSTRLAFYAAILFICVKKENNNNNKKNRCNCYLLFIYVQMFTLPVIKCCKFKLLV
jgi:hypothetical protein